MQVKDLNVSYGEIGVLKDVTLTVEEGKIIGLIGANGAGKTTLLRAISGLIETDSGTIKFNGEEISGIPAHEIVKKGIVQVPEGRRIFPYMSVQDNLLVSTINEKPNRGKEETLEFIYNLLPRLEERKDQMAGTLSGGEGQMVAIAQALMCKPKLLMLDEPSLGLAPKIIGEIYAMFDKIKDQGVTIFLVEQNVKLCLRMAGYAYVLENGEIVLEDTSENLIENQDVKKAYMGIG